MLSLVVVIIKFNVRVGVVGIGVVLIIIKFVCERGALFGKGW
jgi:hypothetical protein